MSRLSKITSFIARLMSVFVVVAVFGAPQNRVAQLGLTETASFA